MEGGGCLVSERKAEAEGSACLVLGVPWDWRLSTRLLLRMEAVLSPETEERGVSSLTGAPVAGPARG